MKQVTITMPDGLWARILFCVENEPDEIKQSRSHSQLVDEFLIAGIINWICVTESEIPIGSKH